MNKTRKTLLKQLHNEQEKADADAQKAFDTHRDKIQALRKQINNDPKMKAERDKARVKHKKAVHDRNVAHNRAVKAHNIYYERVMKKGAPRIDTSDLRKLIDQIRNILFSTLKNKHKRDLDHLPKVTNMFDACTALDDITNSLKDAEAGIGEATSVASNLAGQAKVQLVIEERYAMVPYEEYERSLTLAKKYPNLLNKIDKDNQKQNKK